MAAETDQDRHAEDGRATAAGAVAPERVRVWEDEFHVLHVRVDDEEYADVCAVFAFPVSGKADYVGFLSPDGKEVALVSRLGDLDEKSRRAVEAALARMYYVPKIIRIDSLKEIWGVTHWQVMTDRGYASFEVTSQDNIRKLPGGRYIILDVDGNRFEIEALRRLDKRSQALVHSET